MWNPNVFCRSQLVFKQIHSTKCLWADQINRWHSRVEVRSKRSLPFFSWHFFPLIKASSSTICPNLRLKVAISVHSLGREIKEERGSDEGRWSRDEAKGNKRVIFIFLTCRALDRTEWNDVWGWFLSECCHSVTEPDAAAAAATLTPTETEEEDNIAPTRRRLTPSANTSVALWWVQVLGSAGVFNISSKTHVGTRINSSSVPAQLFSFCLWQQGSCDSIVLWVLLLAVRSWMQLKVTLTFNLAVSPRAAAEVSGGPTQKLDGQKD